MSKPVIRDETVAYHPADFPTDSLIRMARKHAVFADGRQLPALAALLRELCERLAAAPPRTHTSLRELPDYLASPEALHRHLAATKPRRARR